MPRDWFQQLDDIEQAIGKIRAYVAGLNFEGFAADEKTQDAVIRNLEIIGEAARTLPEELKERASAIEWRKITALRNLLIHEYFGVSMPVVWDVVAHKLDELEAACLELRANTSGPQRQDP